MLGSVTGVEQLMSMSFGLILFDHFFQLQHDYPEYKYCFQLLEFTVHLKQ